MDEPPMSASFVRKYRSTAHGLIEEAIHPVEVVVVNAQGQVVAQSGYSERLIAVRDTLKPFQALSLVTSKAMQGLAITPQELALACGSPTGAQAHLEVATQWLKRLNLSEGVLKCGADTSRDAEMALLMERAKYRPEEGYSERPSTLLHRCAGEHLAQLSVLAEFPGLAPQTYLHAQGPVQRRLRQVLASLLPELAECQWGLDGCCSPTPVLGLKSLAHLYALLVASDLNTETTLAPTYREGLAVVKESMAQSPEMMGGRGIIGTRLMRAISKLWITQAKEGLLAFGCEHPTYGALGGAVYIASGSDKAVGPAVMAVLEQLQLVLPAARYALRDIERPELKNTAGLTVGAYEADLTLSFFA